MLLSIVVLTNGELGRVQGRKGEKASLSSSKE